MPSKGDPSRQRRQARNRAEREARLARRESASAPRPSPAEPTADDEGSNTTSAAPRRPTGRRRAFEGRPPGTRAAYYCLIFTIFAFGVTLLTPVPVDADGDPFPRDVADQRSRYRDLDERRGSLSAEDQAELDDLEVERDRYEELAPSGQGASDDEDFDRLELLWVGIDESDDTERLFVAGWPFTIVFLLAVGCGVLAVRISRAPNPARGWMRLLIAMVLLSLLASGSPLLLAPVIALAVAHYQNRKANLVAAGGPAGGRPPPGAGFGSLFGRRPAIDVESTAVPPDDGQGGGSAPPGTDGDGDQPRP